MSNAVEVVRRFSRVVELWPAPYPAPANRKHPVEAME